MFKPLPRSPPIGIRYVRAPVVLSEATVICFSRIIGQEIRAYRVDDWLLPFLLIYKQMELKTSISSEMEAFSLDSTSTVISRATGKPKKIMKRLTCRKCEGHGLISILKGHAASCQFNNCQCDTCKTVMNMRANALIRRFRHRQPGQNAAVLRTIRSKNGNMRLRILPKGEGLEDYNATTVTYTEDSAHVSSPSLSSGSSSPSSSSPLISTASSPVPSPDNLLMEYLQQLVQQQLAQQQLTASLLRPVAQTPLFVPQLFLPQLLNC